jgi:hypothetical protein
MMTSNRKINPLDAANNTEFISFQPPSLNQTAVTTNPGMIIRENDRSMNEEMQMNLNSLGKVGSLKGNYPSTHHNPLLSVSGERNNLHHN